MSTIPGVAYDLAGDPLRLVDLAQASLQITAGFRALEALYLELDGGPGAVRRFRLPLSLPPGPADGGDFFTCGAIPPDRTCSVEAILKEACDLFCTLPDSPEPMAVHAMTPERGGEEIVHLLIFSRSRDRAADTASRQRAVKAMCIWEEARHSRYPRFDEVNPAQGRAFVRAEGLAPHDVIGGFLLFTAAFGQKLDSLSFVNDAFVGRAWEKMLKEGRRNSHLPWERRRSDGGSAPGAEVGTVTLALDLRKSTYMMRQAQDRCKYAYWLEALAEIGRDFTLRHGGIYDKFTGDGAISHFVYDRSDSAYMTQDEAMCAAFRCAHDLILASEVHLRNIEPHLDFLSGKSGAAVGIAHGPAAWSLDRDGRPVVVGAGVVSACRLCGGPSRSIRATVSVKSVLERQMVGIRFADYHLENDHKDLPKVDDPICGEVLVDVAAIGDEAATIRARAETIWNDVLARHA